MSTKKNTKETSDHCSKSCVCSKFVWLIIPIALAAVTWWVLKSTNSVFSSDPLSMWFSMVLSVFVGVWMCVGIKRLAGKKECNDNSHL